MKKVSFWALTIACLFLLFGCGTTGPFSMQEAFPLRNQDPRAGLIINEGTAHLNLYIYDEAGRLVEEIYLRGANQYLTINGKYMPRYWVRRLEVGRYRVEVYPFYYRTEIANIFVGQPVRYRIDLPKQTQWLWVDRNPVNIYYEGRHWGWILRLNGGYIPETAGGLPGIKFNFQGNFR